MYRSITCIFLCAFSCTISAPLVSGNSIWFLANSTESRLELIEESLVSVQEAITTIEDGINEWGVVSCSKLDELEFSIQNIVPIVSSKTDNFVVQSHSYADEGCSVIDAFNTTTASFNDSLFSTTDILQTRINDAGSVVCSVAELLDQTTTSTQDILCTKVQAIQQDVILVSDFFSSLLETISDTIQDTKYNAVSSLEQAESALDSSLFLSKIARIDTSITVLSQEVESLIEYIIDDVQENKRILCSGGELLQSELDLFSDTFCSNNQEIDLKTTSISDVLTTSLQQIDDDIQTLQEVVCSVIEACELLTESVQDSIVTESESTITTVQSVSDVICPHLIDLQNVVNSNGDILCGSLAVVSDLFDSVTDAELQRLSEISSETKSVCDAVLETVVKIDSVSDVLEEQFSAVDQTLMTNSDLIIDAVCSKFEQLDVTLISVSDEIQAANMQNTMSSSALIPKADSIPPTIVSSFDTLSRELIELNDSAASRFDETCLKIESLNDAIPSVSDVMAGTIGGIDGLIVSSLDVICDKIGSIPLLLFSISDTLQGSLDGINTESLSALDTINPKIIDAENTLLSVSDALTMNGSGSISACENVITQLANHDTSICSKIDTTLKGSAPVGFVDTQALLDSFSIPLTATRIIQSDIPFTITSAGRYVLDENITHSAAGGAITIATADSVTLDLKGHRITVPSGSGNGIAVTAAADGTSTVIKNGFISTINEGVLVSTGTSANVQLMIDSLFVQGSGGSAVGFSVDRFSGVVLNNCECNDVDCGILFSHTGTVATIEVRGCKVYNAATSGIEFAVAQVANSALSAVILDTIVQEAASGFRIVAPDGSCVIRKCSAVDCSTVGFIAATTVAVVAPSLRGIFDDCVAKNCGIGFDLTTSIGGMPTFESAMFLHKCCALNGTTGFVVDQRSACRYCTAYSNAGVGFQVNDVDITLEYCASSDNGGDGFDIAFTADDVTLRFCSASNNGVNGIDMNTAGVVLKDCLATYNTGRGLDDNGNATVIRDTRSAGNGLADLTGSSSVVTY